jgi:hypothetical protein
MFSLIKNYFSFTIYIMIIFLTFPNYLHEENKEIMFIIKLWLCNNPDFLSRVK